MRIGPALEREAYRIAREVHEGKSRPTDGIAHLVEAGIKLSSARDYIYILKGMLAGRVYKRGMSTGATNYFLEKILEHYGADALENALTALEGHIAYNGGRMPGYVAVARKYRAQLSAQNRIGKSRPGAQKSEPYIRNVRTPRLLDGDSSSGASDPNSSYSPSGEDTRTSASLQIRLRRGQYMFRKALLCRYGERCLVTGSSILALLEAAHISPYRGVADNHVENGLLLRADIHTLFDLNLLGIEPSNLRIAVNPSIAREYASIVGKRLQCPAGKGPSVAALELRYSEFLLEIEARAKITSA